MTIDLSQGLPVPPPPAASKPLLRLVDRPATEAGELLRSSCFDGAATPAAGTGGVDLSWVQGSLDEALAAALLAFCASAAGSSEGVECRLAHTDLGSGSECEQRLFDLAAERKAREKEKKFHEKKKSESSKQKEFSAAAQMKRTAQTGIDGAVQRLEEIDAELVTLEVQRATTPWFLLFAQLEAQTRNGIQFLDLSDCGLHATGLELLTRALLELDHRGECKKVTRLALDGNDLRDQGMAAIAAFLRLSSNMELLQLRNIGVTEVGVSEACAGLVSNKALHVLDVRNNGNCNKEATAQIVKGIQRFNKGVRILI